MVNIDKERARLLALFDDNEEKVQIVLNFRHKLTPLWFEIYVSRFFRTYSSFKTFQNGGFSDHGIDIKGIRTNQDWILEYLIVQCKKWSSWGIKEKDVAEFYGKVAGLKFQYPNTYLVYSTTGEINLYAQRFAQKNEIVLTDYSDLIEMQKEYPLNVFAFEILQEEMYHPDEVFEKNISDILTTEYAKKTKESIRSKIRSTKDLHSLLKEVRYKIAKEEDIPAYFVFNNKTLESICNNKPKNIHELEQVQWFGEKRIQKYGKRILETLAQVY